MHITESRAFDHYHDDSLPAPVEPPLNPPLDSPAEIALFNAMKSFVFPADNSASRESARQLVDEKFKARLTELNISPPTVRNNIRSQPLTLIPGFLKSDKGYTTKSSLPPVSHRININSPVVALRRAVDKKRLGGYVANNEAVDAARSTWRNLNELKSKSKARDRRVHQDEPVVAPFVSMAESLLGNRKTGLKIGLRAVRLAAKTESPRLDGSNPNLSTGRRLSLKAKALKRGSVAVAVSLLATPNIPRLKRTAWSLAARNLN